MGGFFDGTDVQIQLQIVQIIGIVYLEIVIICVIRM